MGRVGVEPEKPEIQKFIPVSKNVALDFNIISNKGCRDIREVTSLSRKLKLM